MAIRNIYIRQSKGSSYRNQFQCPKSFFTVKHKLENKDFTGAGISISAPFLYPFQNFAGLKIFLTTCFVDLHSALFNEKATSEKRYSQFVLFFVDNFMVTL